MQNYFFKTCRGERCVNWQAVSLFVVLTYLGTVSGAEVFWRLFSGEYSQLMGLFAFVVATLVVIRVVGATLTDPYTHTEAEFRTP